MNKRKGSRILIIVTSHDRIDADRPTGLWFEEFAVPYSRFRSSGFDVTVASPLGGMPPLILAASRKRTQAKSGRTRVGSSRAPSRSRRSTPRTSMRCSCPADMGRCSTCLRIPFCAS